jgi:hypothetical protein
MVTNIIMDPGMGQGMAADGENGQALVQEERRSRNVMNLAL